MAKISKKNILLIAAGAVGAAGGGFALFKALNKKTVPVSKAILILGNGHSETSVLTQSLNFMGVDLGEDKFLGDGSENQKGFLENERIMNIHNEISNKWRMRPAEHKYEKSPEIKPYKDNLKEYIKEQFIHRPVWAWNDPQTSDYLALWNSILKELNIEPHYLLSISNPIHILESNEYVSEREVEWEIRQWQIRTLISLRESYGGKRMIISYDAFIQNPLESLRKISNTLELPWPEDEEKLKSELEAFIDPQFQIGIRNITLDEFKKSKEVTQDVKDLYLLALEGTRSQAVFQSKSFHDRVEKYYQAYLEEYGPLDHHPPIV